MGLIRVLDAAVADQIAAGEVVERPASVVKELVENALDAGARNIEVHIKGGGVERITVIDDGCGMAPDDAVLCFSRHATSKLAAAEDLRRIGTFGFRGEALAAISSIARVRLLTRPAGAAAAWEVRIDGGRVAHVGEAGAPAGTRIDIEELFFNTPARRKFLKALRTEAGHVEDVLCSAALCEPHVGFRLVVDDKLALDLPGAPAGAPLGDARRVERAVLCLGKQVRPHLFPFQASTELLALEGYVVAPLETRRDLAGVHVSVNRRPVADRGLVQAVRTAFRTLLEVGRQPIVALDIALDPELVDVNVHPRKAEVRFLEPRRVSGHVIALLSDFLATTPWLESRRHAAEAAVRPRVMVLADSGAAPSTAEDPLLEAHRDRVRDALARYSVARGPAFPAARAPAQRDAFEKPRAASDMRPLSLVPVAGTGGTASFSQLKVVGQVGGSYLVLEAPEGMVVIDQHAAHERVVFERLRAARAAADAPSQPLLIPLQLELSALEMSALEAEDTCALLARHGLVLEAFGPRTALVKALPPGLDGKKAETIARDALAELAATSSAAGLAARSDALEDRLDRVCARLACHAAVRAGDAMGAESIRALLRALDDIDLGAHCPHGRPVVRTVRYDELGQWFDRR
jgi:DNA mismatch repair protein MutL